ncbi:hypothetical protein [Sphingomonas sp.]
MDLIELIRGKKVMVGAIDVATDMVEMPEEVAHPFRQLAASDRARRSAEPFRPHQPYKPAP